MNQKMKSTILIVVAALGLALTVRMYPKLDQNAAPDKAPQTVETVMETESETILESTVAE